jgi:DNA-binding helix-hairpin-helix protein with protein kinase domain
MGTTMGNNKLYDRSGQPIALGTELGRGGEGSVISLPNHPDYVAKVYHRPVDPERTAKLTAMVEARTERLLRLTAWPVATLHETPRGAIAGFVMPRAMGFKQIHQLYGPKARMAEFPDAQWHFLVHAASNLARAFAVIHEHGHVVGDVNESNILVSDKATVVLIDCDSFQILANGVQYPCLVGVPTHQPAEVQDISSFIGVNRTSNHDNFGLAVVIFQLLFMGRHPFAGRYLGSGDMPIERAIRECVFPYARSNGSSQMIRPPGSLSLEDIPSSTAALFERAFSRGGVRDDMRPTARDWIDNLDALTKQLQRCSRNTAHVFPTAAPSCPWCQIEATAGTVLFNIVLTTASIKTGSFDLTAVWARIAAVPVPPVAPSLPDPRLMQAQPTPEFQRVGSQRRAGVRISIALVIVTFLGSILFLGGGAWVALVVAVSLAWVTDLVRFDKPRADAQRQLEATKSQCQALEERWKRESGDAPFRAKLSELEQAAREHKELPARRQQRLHVLQSTRRQRELQQFLDRHRIASTSISGFGPGRRATLRSYGIETAADVEYHAIIRIQGFGPTLTSALLAWRRSVESRFRFDPSKNLDPRDIAAVEQEIQAVRTGLEQTLTGGAAQLAQIAHQTETRRELLCTEVERVSQALAQAGANRKAV